MFCASLVIDVILVQTCRIQYANLPTKLIFEIQPTIQVDPHLVPPLSSLSFYRFFGASIIFCLFLFHPRWWRLSPVFMPWTALLSPIAQPVTSTIQRVVSYCGRRCSFMNFVRLSSYQVTLASLQHGSRVYDFDRVRFV